MREHGRIKAVDKVVRGSALAQDAAIGATTLVLDDVLDFEEDGGQALVGTEVVTYTAIDDDASTLTLSLGLVAAWTAETEVQVHPQIPELRAQVMLDEEPDALLIATIPHPLRPLLGEGQRTVGEAVAVELHRGEWMVADVLGKTPDLTYEEVDWKNEQGLALIGGNPVTDTPHGVFGMGVISPIFAAEDPTTYADKFIAHHPNGPTWMDAQTIDFSVPIKVVLWGQVDVANVSVDNYTLGLFLGVQVDGGTTLMGTSSREYVPANTTRRQLVSLIAFHVAPAVVGTPSELKLRWGYRVYQAGDLSRKATIYYQRMIYALSYAPDFSPEKTVAWAPTARAALAYQMQLQPEF